MDGNENSVLFSLSHLRRLAAPTLPGSGGAAALTITRPGNAPFVPLGVMPPMLMAAARPYRASWLAPALVSLGALLIVCLAALVVVLARQPEPVAVPAAQPAVLPVVPAAAAVATPLPEPQPAPAAAETSAEAAAPVTAASTDSGKSKERKVSKASTRKKLMARRSLKKKQRLASRTVARPSKVNRRSRNEIDALLDAAMR